MRKNYLIDSRHSYSIVSRLGGVMQNWGLERDKVRDVPIYELCQFNDYYEEIFYNKK